MRTLVALTLAILMLLPAGSAAAPPAPGVAVSELQASGLVTDRLNDAAALAALATSFPQGAGLGAQLATLTGASAVALPAMEFDDALAALYDQAGLTLPATYARPEPALAAALAPVLVATTFSAQSTEEAFVGLTSEERDLLLMNFAVVLAPVDDAVSDALAVRVQDLAARVDMPKMALGAATLAAALDAFTSPGGVMASWSDPQGLIEIGSTGNDVYCTERVLIIDLGGNDHYDCHPASYAPGSSLPLPVSVILDLGGNDLYTTYQLHISSPSSTWGQGVGIAGVGLIVDRWGDDLYDAHIRDLATYCDADFWIGAPQTVFAQAVGAFGIGAILDASGNDEYLALNVNTIFNYCHFGWEYTFAQGAALLGGVGILVDDTGDDRYYVTSSALGKADNIAAVFAQAVSAGGVSALVDKEGSDTYTAEAFTEITQGYTKGGFAYVFSQASVAATRHQPEPRGFGPAVIDFNTPAGLCPNVDGMQAGTLSGNGICDGPGVAVLIDILGDDAFHATATANDFDRGCYNGLWSVVSAQGSAAWTGFAALVNLDVEGTDLFDIQSRANGTGCGSPGTRAHSYGQGYAGPVLWDFWDLPLPPSVEQHPVGILASLGVPSETCPGPLTLDSGGPIIVVGVLGPVIDPSALPQPTADPCKSVRGIPHLTASPDAYYAIADVVNPTYIGDAQTWVQGSSQESVVVSAHSSAKYHARGAGIHIDVGGDDKYDAFAIVKGALPTAIVTGQAGTRDAVAVLANIGGADVYRADVKINGISVLALTLVQGYADASGGTPVGPICAAPSVLTLCLNPVTLPTSGGVAVFVEIFGMDSYSEAVERTGCHTNGNLMGTWPLGVPLGTAWWGHVLGHPCSSPATDTGNGTVIGLDWWSDAY